MGTVLLTVVALAWANPYAPAPAATSGEDPFAWEIEAPVLAPGAEGRLELRLVVPPEHVVYRDQLEVRVVEGTPLSFGSPDYPPGRVKPDPADGTETREQYDLDVVVHLPVQAPPDASGLVPVSIVLRHQGCWNRLCYPPVTQEQTVLVPVRATVTPDE